MDLPPTVFLLARVPEGGPSETRMELLILEGPGQRTPVFSSIRTAAEFLAQAQQLGHTVAFDYLFRTDALRLASDFPEYEPILDPTADAVFGGPATPTHH